MRSLLVSALVVCLAAAASRVPAVQAQAGPGATPESIRAAIAALQAPEARARAVAACQLAAMRLDALPALVPLTRLLADAAPVAPVVCSDDSYAPFTTLDTGQTSPGFQAARALVALGIQGREVLRREALSEDANVRRHAIRGLTYFSDRQLLPIFLEALKDTDASIRADAARALGRNPFWR